MTQRVVAGLGAASGADVLLDLGSTHPSTHGALRLRLELDGEVVVAAEPQVGLVHRGAEKLFEVRDYRAVLVLANRHDWLSAFSNELGVCRAVETMMGLELPPRAVWLRTLLAELNRVLSHLAFLSASLPGAPGVAEREGVLAVMEEQTGGRVHYTGNRIGGLVHDVPAGWPDRTRAAVAAVRTRVPGLREAVERDLGAARGLAVLDPAVALAHGASGPVARASGVDVDLRRDDPYLAYAELDVPVVLRAEGDALARFTCLVEQVAVSLDLVEQCLDLLPGGPVQVRLPKTVRAPEGTAYAWTENPLGAMGWYLVSRGERTPWRLAMRTASFNHVSMLPALLPGVRVRDLPTALASLFFVLGDVDK